MRLKKLAYALLCLSTLTACETLNPQKDPNIFRFAVVAHDEIHSQGSEDDAPREAIVFYGKQGERFWVLRGDSNMRGAAALCDGRGTSYGVMSIQDSGWDFILRLARDTLQGGLFVRSAEDTKIFYDQDGKPTLNTYHKVSFFVPHDRP